MAGDDDDRTAPPPDSKLTRTKEQWAREGRFLTGLTASADKLRLPPGQHLTNDWPVLDLGITPKVTATSWKLDVHGAVERPQFWSLADLRVLPQTRNTSDIHCVTTWSRYDNEWDGVSTRDLVDICLPHVDASHVLLHSYDGYTTNLDLNDFTALDAMLVHSWSGKPLTAEHGGPVRLVLPHLYFWKSAKWIQRIEFLTHDKQGYWEERGYHNRGDPWAEQRYSND